ncbi:MAG TPA: hypothetical protein VFJ28_00660 [Marmoricola sp.]|nr:hypothetical protein [Marmoricola sp.]
MLLPSARRRRAAVVLVGLLTFVLGAGCSDEEERAAPEPEPTPIDRLNTAAMQIPRIQFCPRIDPGAIADALGGEPDDDRSWGNGDEAPVLPGGRSDVVQELGCEWTTEDGVSARAWVFARPVTARLASRVVRDAAGQERCRTAGNAGFGDPSYRQVCRVGDTQRARRAGLFGQTWLTCELTVPASTPAREVDQRTDAWCVEVVNALNTSR